MEININFDVSKIEQIKNGYTRLFDLYDKSFYVDIINDKAIFNGRTFFITSYQISNNITTHYSPYRCIISMIPIKENKKNIG